MGTLFIRSGYTRFKKVSRSPGNDYSLLNVTSLFCSLQDNINVDEAARFLVENILANDKGLPYEESNGDRIKLDQEPVLADVKSGCC